MTGDPMDAMIPAGLPRWWVESREAWCCPSEAKHVEHVASTYFHLGACDQCGRPMSGWLDVGASEYAYCADCETYWCSGENWDGFVTSPELDTVELSHPAFGTEPESHANAARLSRMREIADPWAKVPAWVEAFYQARLRREVNAAEGDAR